MLLNPASLLTSCETVSSLFNLLEAHFQVILKEICSSPQHIRGGLVRINAILALFLSSLGRSSNSPSWNFSMNYWERMGLWDDGKLGKEERQTAWTASDHYLRLPPSQFIQIPSLAPLPLPHTTLSESLPQDREALKLRQYRSYFHGSPTKDIAIESPVLSLEPQSGRRPHSLLANC